VKEGVSSLLGGISKALVIAPDDDYQLTQIVGGQPVVFDRYKVRLTVLLAPPTRILCCRRCLFVCPLATLRKNFQMDLHEICREGWQWANEQ